MSSIREQIVVAVVEALEEISVANGYENNIPGGVQRFQQEGAELSQYPSLHVAIEQEQKERIESNICDCTLTVGIAIVTVDHDGNPAGTGTIVDSLTVDVERALAVDSRFGELAIDSEVDSISPQPLVEGQPFVGCTLNLLVRYRHDISDPRVPR